MIAPSLKRLAVPIDSVQPHPRNARQGDVGALVQSLERFGQVRPIVVQESTGHVLAGNHLWRAARQLGWKKIAVVRIDVDDETALAYLVADNRTADLGTYDDPALGEILRELAEADLLEGTGYDGDDVDAFLADLARDADEAVAEGDFDPEVDLPAETVTEPGVVIEMGRHRLICGDAFDAETRAILLDGVHPTAILTDPPYGMNLDTDFRSVKGSAKAAMKGWEDSAKVHSRVIGDDRPFDARPLVDAYAHVAEQFWFGADYYRPTLSDDPQDGSWLVWDKRNEESDDMIGSGFELIWSKRRHQRRLLRHFQAGTFGSDGPREHPTQKPSRLFADTLQRWVPEGAAVFDPFAGIGTTLMAAMRTGRTAYLMEIDPRYCDVIRARYEAAAVNVETTVVA